MKPITPKEAEGKRIEAIAPEIIQAVNELIVENLKNGRASIKQELIIERYCALKKIENTQDVRRKLYDRNQLDFEDIFRKTGWNVEYHSPDYTESYDPYFDFKYNTKS